MHDETHTNKRPIYTFISCLKETTTLLRGKDQLLVGLDSSVSQPFPVQGPVEKPTKFCGPPKIMP
jgi:hypothetical protein